MNLDNYNYNNNFFDNLSLKEMVLILQNGHPQTKAGIDGKIKLSEILANKLLYFDVNLSIELYQLLMKK